MFGPFSVSVFVHILAEYARQFFTTVTIERVTIKKSMVFEIEVFSVYVVGLCVSFDCASFFFFVAIFAKFEDDIVIFTATRIFIKDISKADRQTCPD